MARMKEQNKNPEKELNEMETTNQPIRCRVQNTGDQDAQRTHWIWQQYMEDMKVTLSDILKNLQGINSGGREARIQINYLEHKEEISIQPEEQEEKKFKKSGIV